MMQELQPLVYELTDSNRARFVRALAEFRVLSDESLRLRNVIEVGRELTSSVLSESEKGDRLRQILRAAALSHTSLEKLAVDLCMASPGVKNAAATIMPAEYRPLLFGLRKASGLPDTLPRRDAAMVTVSLTTQTAGSLSSVVILATEDQTANIHILRGHGYAAVRVSTLQEFWDLVKEDDDVAAIVIDGSFWGQLTSKDEQLEHLRDIASFSTFVWIRIHQRNLRMTPAEIYGVFRSAHCRQAPAEQLWFQPDSLIREEEIENIDVARKLLKTGADGRFIPGEFDQRETDILMAAAGAYVRNRGDGELKLASLTTRFMRGKSPARIATVTINSNGVPVVAKLDAREPILEEASRFTKYVGPFDSRLSPFVSFHGKTGVILFGLVDDASDPAIPAPTLESQLEALWAHEMYRYGDKPEGLPKAIDNAVKKLERLNSQHVTCGDCVSHASPVNPALEELEIRGMRIYQAPGLAETRRHAESIFNVKKDCAIVHGDVHLQNILVRAGVEAFFIDYFHSGPGHPAIDLVRLECCLFTKALRAFGDEQSLDRIQQCLNDPSKGYADVALDAHGICEWEINRIVLQGAFACRNAVLRVLSKHSASFQDYLAVKCLVGWQAIVISGPQLSCCRAIINAIKL